MALRLEVYRVCHSGRSEYILCHPFVELCACHVFYDVVYKLICRILIVVAGSGSEVDGIELFVEAYRLFFRAVKPEIARRTENRSIVLEVFHPLLVVAWSQVGQTRCVRQQVCQRYILEKRCFEVGEVVAHLVGEGQLSVLREFEQRHGGKLLRHRAYVERRGVGNDKSRVEP